MTTTPHPRAGAPAAADDLIDVTRIVTAYYADRPDPGISGQRVAFGTSGHRGSSLVGSFNDDHIAAIAQAICDYRRSAGIDGPLFLGKDTHALSGPAWATAAEVLAANHVTLLVDSRDGYTPTPAISHAILTHNRHRGADRTHSPASGQADGIVVTPSHNPPADGGFKYNPPHGGPADSEVTTWIADRANALLEARLGEVRRIPLARALAAPTTDRYDFLDSYVGDLPSVIDLEVVATAAPRLGADPMGGASVAYWAAIADRYGLDLTVVNPQIDPTWQFMTLDWDGKIRMDCSSEYAMASLLARADEFRIATGNDADADRHGIVTAEGLMNPNHYLAVAIDYLYRHRSRWPETAAVGKTLVSSALIDRVAAGLGRTLWEVPVGFKWFVPGLLDGTIGFGGEESAGAAFLRHDGTPWTTDKDGIIASLLAAEITGTTERTPAEHYAELVDRYGQPHYARVDTPASAETKQLLGTLTPDQVEADELAGDPITQTLTTAPGNDAPIGGLKVVTASGWFAARPSGTEDVYKIYAESFDSPQHLDRIQQQARELLDATFTARRGTT